MNKTLLLSATSLLLICLLLINNCDAALQESDDDESIALINSCRKIEAFLTKEFIDPEKLMQKAIKLLRLKQICSCLPIFNQCEQVIYLLEKLEKLKLSVEKRHCGLESKEIRESLVTINQNNSCVRFGIVVYHYSKELTKVCQEEYMKEYLSKRGASAEFNSNMQLFFLEFIRSELIGKHQAHRIASESDDARSKYIKWASSNRILYSIHCKFIVANSDLASREFAVRVYKLIKRVSNEKAQSVSKNVLGRGCSWHEAIEIFDAQIHKPCQEYVDSFGPSLFDLAQLDVDFLGWRDIQELKGEDRAEFYLAWAQYRVCKHLIDNISVRARLLNYISEETDLVFPEINQN